MSKKKGFVEPYIENFVSTLGKCIYQVMLSFSDTGSATVNWRVLP